MKKILSASIICLGLAGTVTSHAQISGGTYNPSPASTAGFPLLIGNVGTTNGASPTQLTSVSSTGVVNTSFVTGINGPSGLATNGDGTVYAATFLYPSTPQLTRFDGTTGAIISTISGIPAVPNGLTFGSNGSLYATTAPDPNQTVPNPSDPANPTKLNDIVRFNPATGATTVVVASQLLNQPQGITMGPDGNLYVANAGNNRILKISPDGTLITNLGATGLSRPIGLIFDHNTLFVSNNSGGISAYNGSLINNDFILTATTPTFSILADPTNNGINGPEGLTVGPNGNIYFANDDSGAGDGTLSNIDMLVVNRDANGVPVSFGSNSVIAQQDAALGASFVVFVPEPSTYAMFAVASIALAFFGVRRRMTLRA